MPTYNEVLNQIQSLPISEQLRLSEELKNLLDLGVEVEGTLEMTSVEEITESEAAGQDDLALCDRLISSKDRKSKLYGVEIEGDAIGVRPVTSVPLWQRTTPAERVKEWHNWVQKHHKNVKELPDEALHRDSIYD